MAKLENGLIKLGFFVNKYIGLVVLVLSIPAVWALLVPGFYGASDDLHVAWLFEMDHALRLGQFPPRFVPDLSYQFGYPLFNFVFPLPFYIGEIFHLVGLNLVDSVKALFLITVPLSMFWMYKFLRQFAGVFLGLAGASLYVYTPYRANDLYNRGDIGEIVAFAVLPLICLSVLKIASWTPATTGLQVRVGKWVGIGALAIGSLILIHDITAYMFFAVVAVLGLALVGIAKQKTRTTILLAGTGILGLLVSLYFWYPAIADSGLMKYDTVFDFQDHFPTLIQLIKPYWGYGASVPGPYDGMSFFIGIFNWIGFLVGIPILVFWRQKFSRTEKIITIWGYGVFLLAIFMMDFRSTFLWKILPELPYFQFPWRFLILTTFVTPIFLMTLEKIKYSQILGLGLIIIIISTNAFQFRPHDFLGRTDSYYLNRYVPYPQASYDYTQTQEEYLRLPVDTKVRPNHIYSSFFADQPITSTSIQNNPLNYEAQIVATQSSQVSFDKYSFPGWNVTVDGAALKPEAGLPFGQINFPLQPGTHIVHVFFQETTSKKLLDIISLVSLIVILGLFLPRKYRKFRRS